MGYTPNIPGGRCNPRTLPLGGVAASQLSLHIRSWAAAASLHSPFLRRLYVLLVFGTFGFSADLFWFSGRCTSLGRCFLVLLTKLHVECSKDHVRGPFGGGDIATSRAPSYFPKLRLGEVLINM